VNRLLLYYILMLAFLVRMPAIASAQEQAGDRPAPPAAVAPGESKGTMTSLSVRIVITREQDGKKVSSVPYVLSLADDLQLTRLRMTTRVPIPTGALAEPSEEGPAPGSKGPTFFTYEEVGTSIDCQARPLPDGRYRLTISIEDSSVYVGKRTTDGRNALSERPSFRVYRSSQHVVMRDGGSVRYTMATDKTTGEVVEVQASLTVVGK
jgi:hypothetical protein